MATVIVYSIFLGGALLLLLFPCRSSEHTTAWIFVLLPLLAITLAGYAALQIALATIMGYVLVCTGFACIVNAAEQGDPLQQVMDRDVDGDVAMSGWRAV
jgi:lysylphosphatidylglycerol synthetase-like protein (DUF2156 family)